MPAPYTLYYFEKIIDDLPPLAPKNSVDAIKQKIERLRSENQHQEIVEDVLLDNMLELAPWRLAFKEFESAAVSRLGEEYFISFLSEQMKNWLNAYKEHNGTFLALSKCAPNKANIMMQFLSPDERNEMAVALAEAGFMARETAKKEVMAHMKNEYERRVDYHSDFVKTVIQKIEKLEELANEISFEPLLRKEILNKINEIKLAVIGLNEFKRHELENLKEHYLGRIEERAAQGA